MKRSNLHNELLQRLMDRVIGQESAIRSIVPYVETHQAGLSPDGRPLGVFLLLGPTGTGKTRTVEAIAEVLHGSPKQVLKVDCGEFHLEHEVAKLIGAPPGYLGHKETAPLLTQSRLSSMASRWSDISIVLFDEIEKAAPSLTRLLLGVLDKGTLRLGDNSHVNFERCMIFFTSNLGARNIMKALQPGYGFHDPDGRPVVDLQKTIEHAGMQAVRKHFPPEFVNRLDAAVTYQPLSQKAMQKILDLQLRELQTHIRRRLGERSFDLDVRPHGRKYLLEQGTSIQYGAREMRRTIQRRLIQPLAELVTSGTVAPGGVVRVDFNKRRGALSLKSA